MYCSDCRAATNPNYKFKSREEKKYIFQLFFSFHKLWTPQRWPLWTRIFHHTLQLSSRKTVTHSNDSQQGLWGNRAIIFLRYKTMLLRGHWWRAMSPVHSQPRKRPYSRIILSRASRWGLSSGAETFVFCDCTGCRVDHPAGGISYSSLGFGTIRLFVQKIGSRNCSVPRWLSLCFKLVLRKSSILKILSPNMDNCGLFKSCLIFQPAGGLIWKKNNFFTSLTCLFQQRANQLTLPSKDSHFLC